MQACGVYCQALCYGNIHWRTVGPDHAWECVRSGECIASHTHTLHFILKNHACARCGIGGPVGWSAKPHSRFDVDWTGPVCRGERRAAFTSFLSIWLLWSAVTARLVFRQGQRQAVQNKSRLKTPLLPNSLLGCLWHHSENYSSGRRPGTETITVLSIWVRASDHIISFQKVLKAVSQKGKP